MNINKNSVNTLMHDQSWKAPAIVAVVSLLILILLDSVLFALALALLKLALVILAFVALIRAGMLGWPVLVQKINDARS